MRTKADHEGQLEIDGIATPLGEAAEIYLQKLSAKQIASDEVDDAQAYLISLMKAVQISVLKYKGDTLRYKPGSVTAEQIQVVAGV